MPEMKRLAAAYKALREAIEAGDWYASLKAIAEVTAALAEAGQAIVGPFLPGGGTTPTIAGVDDVWAEVAALEAVCNMPRVSGANAAGFDWSTLIPMALKLIELFRNRK